MTSEQIRVSEENWRRLNGLKRPGESFDDVIGRVLDDRACENEAGAR